MKKILLIGTGGTIASTPTNDGLAPSVSSEDLVKLLPELKEICEVDCVQPFMMDSTNMRPKNWIMLGKMIEENYDKYDGFVIIHGTDTMAYTAAALSYIVQNNRKPIVLTGSQIPATQPNSDGLTNLKDAICYACEDRSMLTTIVFGGVVICGTRARKNYSKSFFAFGSINYPELAHIQHGRISRFIPQHIKEELKFYTKINDNVGLIKFIPGMNNEVMDFVINKHDGLVVESFGVGGLPEYTDFYEQIKKAVAKNKLICMTTQVPNEGSDLSIYQVGKVLKDQFKVLEAHDMTTEAALVKIMWILGQTDNFEEAEKMFYKKINTDILYF